MALPGTPASLQLPAEIEAYCVKCKADIEKQQAQTKRFEEDRVYREISLGEDEEA